MAEKKTERPNNADMWDRLQTTDAQFTKSFQRAGGFSGTAINGAYILKRLTEEFGPCGIGWRFIIEEENILEGHTLKNGDKAKVHVIRGCIEYTVGAQKHQTSSQFGQTYLVYENRNGAYTDEEAPKKSITDAIGKCAVQLGIGADIHLGLYDDNKYVNERRKEAAESAGQQSGGGNGQANPQAGSQGPEPGRASPPNDQAKVNAMKWAEEQEVLVSKMDASQLAKWEKEQNARLGRLKQYAEKTHAHLLETVRGRYAKLDDAARARQGGGNSANAGEPFDDEIPF